MCVVSNKCSEDVPWSKGMVIMDRKASESATGVRQCLSASGAQQCFSHAQPRSFKANTDTIGSRKAVAGCRIDMDKSKLAAKPQTRGRSGSVWDYSVHSLDGINDLLQEYTQVLDQALEEEVMTETQVKARGCRGEAAPDARHARTPPLLRFVGWLGAAWPPHIPSSSSSSSHVSPTSGGCVDACHAFVQAAKVVLELWPAGDNFATLALQLREDMEVLRPVCDLRRESRSRAVLPIKPLCRVSWPCAARFVAHLHAWRWDARRQGHHAI